LLRVEIFIRIEVKESLFQLNLCTKITGKERFL